MAFIAGWLAEQVACRPEQPALIARSLQWTWRELFDQGRIIASKLIAAGVKPGSLVALATGTCPEFVFGLAGIVLAKGVPVIIDPEAPTLVNAALDGADPALVITSSSSSCIAGRRPSLQLELDNRTIHFSLEGCVDPLAVTRPALALVLTSSGTTAAPKIICWSRSRLRYVSWLWWRSWQLRSHHRRIGLLTPLSYAMGLFPLLQAWARGSELVLIEDSHATVPALEMMDTFDVTLFVCTPTHVVLLLRANAPAPPSLEQVRVTGAPITDQLMDLSRLWPNVDVCKSYGLAEVGAVTLLRGRELPKHAMTCGRRMPGVRVEVCDEEGDRLPLGQTGEIVVRLGHHVAEDGYLAASEAVARRFSAGRLRTGDYGYLDDQGYLTLTSRVPQLLKVAGRAVSASRIESVLASATALTTPASFAVVGIPHARYGQVPALVYDSSIDSERSIEQRMGQARDVLRSDERPRLFLPRPGLPWTSTGKLRRGVLATEAARWSASWTKRLAYDGWLWPSRVVSSKSPLFCLDGVTESWLEEASYHPPDGVRCCAYVKKSGESVELVALASLRAGLDQASGRVRVIYGPRFLSSEGIADDALIVADLLQLAPCLPGPECRIRIIDSLGQRRSVAALQIAGLEQIGQRGLFLAPMQEQKPVMSDAIKERPLDELVAYLATV